MKSPSWPDVTGPLECYAAAYRENLFRLGYSRWAASAHLYLLADVSGWLDEHCLKPGDFGSERVGEFLSDRRAGGHVSRLSPRGLIPLLGYLRGLGVLAEDTPPGPSDPVGRLLEAFVEFLVDQRGLAPRTVVGYERFASLFLIRCAPDSTIEGCGVERLGAADINAFLLSECVRRSVGSANNMVTALRALLRFLYLRGSTPVSLAECVPPGAAWRDSGRSRALEACEVRRLLASCDRRTASGRRDFAILTVLSRVGLRANEVASLTVDDVDWRAGEISVSGKGARRDRLPLPADVGEALAAYCQRGRPRNEHRALFLHGRAPYSALSSSAMSSNLF